MNSLPNNSSSDAEQSITLNLPQAARRLGISESLARQLAKRGEFPGAFRLGGRILVHRAIFEDEVARLAHGKSLSVGSDAILKRALTDASVRLDNFITQR
jgi:predicted DNA-binding transcriptional regulator AlpA